MLRLATAKDQELVVSMALSFLENSPYKTYGDEANIRNLVAKVLEGDGSSSVIILHGEDGMIAGMVSPFLFGAQTVATELAWWVNEDKRGTKIGAELLEAFEYWAGAVGCNFISMVSLDDSLGKYYEKKGYTLSERTYIKEV